MNRPRIEIITPTSRAWQGMATILFRPFDIGKWFLLGFSAWLAALLDGAYSSGGSYSSDTGGTVSGSPKDILETGQNWINEHLGPVILVVSLVVGIILAIWLALLWVSSRGKFMLLDNCVHNRALVQEPWSRLRDEGNSLFLWRLLFTFGIVFILVMAAGMAFALFGGGGAPEELTIVAAVAGGLLFVILLLAAGYISVLLEDFVIPIMYRDGINATEAWRKLLAVHSQAMGSFILYVLWRLLLSFGVAAAVIAAGFATCCIGFFILAIPYLGTVLLLPVPVFFRLLGPEFIRQFGPDYDAFATSESLPAPSPTAR